MYIHTYIYTNIHTYIHTYSIYIHTYILQDDSSDTCKILFASWALQESNMLWRKGAHTYIYTYIYIYIHTYMHTYIHTYMHTYIHAGLKDMAISNINSNVVASLNEMKTKTK